MRTLLIGEFMVRLVIIIMIDDRHITVEILLKLLGDRGLAAAGSAGDADHHDFLVLH